MSDDPGRVRGQIISVACQIQRFDLEPPPPGVPAYLEEVCNTGRPGGTCLPQKSVQHPHTNQPICMRGTCPGVRTYLEEVYNTGRLGGT